MTSRALACHAAPGPGTLDCHAHFASGVGAATVTAMNRAARHFGLARTLAFVAGTMLLGGQVHAAGYAAATDNIRNGTVMPNGAGITFGPVAPTSSSAASLDSTGVSFATVVPNPDAPVSALGSASSRPNELTTGGVYYTLIGSNGTNYSWGDANVVQEQTATQTITARNAAETNIATQGFGNADGTNKSSTGLSVNVANNCGGACTISFAFQADPFIMAMVDAGALPGSIARGTLGFDITLTRIADNTVVFDWNPNGAAGGITGGIETGDPEGLNLTVAAFAGQTVTYSGPYGADSFGSYGATTDPLAAGGYSLSIFMNEKTDVARAIPEPHTYALMLAGLGVVVFLVRRRRL